MYPVKSGIIAVTAGQGIPAALGGAGSSPFRVSRDMPQGCRALIRSVSLTILNGPAGQLLLSLGSTGPLANWSQVNGQLFSAAGEIPIGEIVDAPGPLFVDISNITGTTFAGAQGAPVTINCLVIMDCVLLVETNRGRIHG